MSQLESSGDSQALVGRTQLLCSEGWCLKGVPAFRLSLPAGREVFAQRNVTTAGILVPWGGLFDSTLHHPQLSSWQPDRNQIGFNAFHNFVEQICGLREQIKPTFLFGIIKNVTRKLEMDIPGLGIDTVNPKPFLPRIFFRGWFPLRFLGSLVPNLTWELGRGSQVTTGSQHPSLRYGCFLPYPAFNSTFPTFPHVRCFAFLSLWLHSQIWHVWVSPSALSLLWTLSWANKYLYSSLVIN